MTLSAPGTIPMPRRAYPYGRVSDPRQLKGDGLARQDDWAQEVCEEEGWALDDTYHFADRGKSGFHGEHLGPKGDLTRCLGMIREGTITPGSVLLIENIDRLGRQEVDLAYDTFREIIKAGVWIRTKTPPRLYRRESAGLMDLMEPIWLMYLAHQESLKKSERLKDKWERRRARARAGNTPHGRRCPAWIELTPEGYRLRPGPARTVRTIFRLAREGLGVQRIANWLNARLADHPPLGKSRQRKKEAKAEPRWLRSYVREIARGRVAIGEFQPHVGRCGRRMAPEGDPIPGYYPAAVTEQEWQLAQAALDGRRRKAGRPGAKEANLFTGIVYERATGQAMCLDGRNGLGKTYRYLVAYRKGGSCKRGGGLPYAQFEDGILRAIRRLETRDVLPPDAAADAREARIGELTGRLVTLSHLMEARGRDLDAEDDPDVSREVRASIKRLADEKKSVGKELEALKLQSLTGRAESLETIKSILELLDKAKETPGEEEVLRRRLKSALRWVVEEIWVDVQPVSQRAYIGHAMIYLRSGGRPRYVQLPPLNARPGLVPWDLSGADFRAVDVGDVARRPARPQKVG
jgi:DNA invertase Pin-like site-specific DNA recombinase